MRKFYCAKCGKEIRGEVYMFQDDFLLSKYFDDYKSNRFCDRECAAEALFCELEYPEDVPPDDDEKEEDEEEEEEQEE